jgi:hypothetical protein
MSKTSNEIGAEVMAETPMCDGACDQAPPSQPDGQGDGLVCSACGERSRAGVFQCVKCGRWLPGNQAARELGLYARNQPADLRESVDTLAAGIVADRGGESELTTLERAYVGRLADVEITLRLIAADIAARGLLTPAGGVRNVYDKFLAGIDRWDRLAQRLGLGRHAKRLNVAEQCAALHATEPRCD